MGKGVPVLYANCSGMCRYLKQLRTKHSKKLKLFSMLTVKICKVALLLAKTTSHFLFPCLAVNLETKSKTTSK